MYAVYIYGRYRKIKTRISLFLDHSIHYHYILAHDGIMLSALYWWVGGTSASDQQSTNDRKVAGSRPTKVVCITVLTGNCMGWTARCGRPTLLLPSCRSLGKWHADAFLRSIISEAIYHLPFTIYMLSLVRLFVCLSHGWISQNGWNHIRIIKFSPYCRRVSIFHGISFIQKF